MGKLLKSLSVG
jgi:hypothetical protein